MRGLRRFFRRWTSRDVRVEEEMALHLEHLAAEHRQRGLSPEDARFAARRDFGGVAQVKERYRDGQGWRWVDMLRHDLGAAVRSLRCSPGFVFATVLTLGLGIAANLTLFALADATIFKPYPFVDQDRLVIAGEAATDTRAEVSYLNFRDWQTRSRSFDGLAAMGQSNWTMTLREDEPETVLFRAVSGNWFEVLGAASLLGRVITGADDVQGAPRVVVLSHAFWRRHFGGRADIVAKTVRLDDALFTVIGVMPAEFAYPVGADVWTPLVPVLASLQGANLPDFLEDRGVFALHLVGRLKTGVSLEAARVELAPIVSELARVDGGTRLARPRITPLLEDVLGSARVGLLALLAAAGVLLLVTLANTSGLMLVRASRRSRETAVRAALGASRWTLARQWLWESAILAVLAAISGHLLAHLSLPVLLTYVPDIPRVAGAAIDGRVSVVTTLLALCTAVGCWISQMAGVRRTGLAATLRETSRSIASHQGRRTRAILVSFEMTATVVLLAGAILLYRSVVRVGAVDPGFDARGLLAVTLDTPDALDGDLDGSRRFYARALDVLATVPGVEAVGAAGSRPLKGPIGLDSMWEFEGQSPDVSTRNPWANIETVTSGYISAMRTPLRAGRLLDERDTAESERVVVVSEALARYAWPGTPAVGRRLRAAALDGPEQDVWFTVVGVVADVRYRTLGAVSLDVYAPVSQSPFGARDIMVRTHGELAAMAPVIRSRLRELNPQGVVSLETMSDALAAHQAPWRSNLLVFSVFAGMTLVLCLLGVYTLLAALVAERRRDIGVRLALGATPARIGVHVLRTLGGVTLVGLAAGGLVAGAMGGAIRALLFEVGPRDAGALSAALAVVAVAAIVGGLVPLRRACTTDPLIVLRAE